jgi:hypothetical protein
MGAGSTIGEARRDGVSIGSIQTTSGSISYAFARMITAAGVTDAGS